MPASTLMPRTWMRGKDGTWVVRLRVVDAHLIEQRLDRQFQRLLGATRGEVPSLVVESPFHLAGDLSSLAEETIRALAVGHRSTTSPGRQSGFRSQYQLPSGNSIRWEPSSAMRRRTASQLLRQNGLGIIEDHAVVHDVEQDPRMSGQILHRVRNRRWGRPVSRPDERLVFRARVDAVPHSVQPGIPEARPSRHDIQVEVAVGPGLASRYRAEQRDGHEVVTDRGAILGDDPVSQSAPCGRERRVGHGSKTALSWRRRA